MKSRYFDTSELEKLRLVMSESAFLPLRVSLETGLRIGDVVALKRCNLKEDGLHFQARKTRKNGVAKITKGLRKELESTHGKWLFPSPYKRGAHLTRQAVWKRMKTAGERAELDLEGLSPHSLRKIFAVEVYREKGFKAVKEALQHNNTATTEIYAFADWSTGENANKSLQRKDLQLIVKMVLEALGDTRQLVESRSKKRG